jgi:hypothetical protein
VEYSLNPNSEGFQPYLPHFWLGGGGAGSGGSGLGSGGTISTQYPGNTLSPGGSGSYMPSYNGSYRYGQASTGGAGGYQGGTDYWGYSWSNALPYFAYPESTYGSEGYFSNPGTNAVANSGSAGGPGWTSGGGNGGSGVIIIKYLRSAVGG